MRKVIRSSLIVCLADIPRVAEPHARKILHQMPLCLCFLDFCRAICSRTAKAVAIRDDRYCCFICSRYHALGSWGLLFLSAMRCRFPCSAVSLPVAELSPVDMTGLRTDFVRHSSESMQRMSNCGGYNLDACNMLNLWQNAMHYAWRKCFSKWLR